jgi:hypothetical protein
MEDKIRVEKINEEFKKMFDAINNLMSTQVLLLNESIALSNTLLEHALAVASEVVKWKGNIEPIAGHGYAREKIEAMLDDIENMEHRLEISKENPKLIYGDLVFDYDKFKWKLKEVV